VHPQRVQGQAQQPVPVLRRRVKMTRLRQRVAERLKGAQNTYAMLTTFNEVDMSSLIDMRLAYKVCWGPGTTARVPLWAVVICRRS
jgi:2-oxoglutarate dehydrogenase E2 component (dihydrolipoamide succinyltransferase)